MSSSQPQPLTLCYRYSPAFLLFHETLVELQQSGRLAIPDSVKKTNVFLLTISTTRILLAHCIIKPSDDYVDIILRNTVCLLRLCDVEADRKKALEPWAQSTVVRYIRPPTKIEYVPGLGQVEGHFSESLPLDRTDKFPEATFQKLREDFLSINENIRKLYGFVLLQFLGDRDHDAGESWKKALRPYRGFNLLI
eukprot:TRINITY_DN20448_c0_g1_i1.p1 TRINITY_DN20448_c0_g1~~TRINITY_DN20448_c0_g1_i1.p1  ORF type:complete len:201 (+),score=34.32 TRINITY_DN20448_c0_g1_i1:24-605(+)